MILWFWVFFVQHFIRISGTGNNVLLSFYKIGFSVYLSICLFVHLSPTHLLRNLAYDIWKGLRQCRSWKILPGQKCDIYYF